MTILARNYCQKITALLIDLDRLRDTLDAANFAQDGRRAQAIIGQIRIVCSQLDYESVKALADQPTEKTLRSERQKF